MFKIVKDNTVIDIIDEPNYVVYQERNNMLLSTDRLHAQGIVSSDGSTVWQLLGRPPLRGGDYSQAELKEITEEEAIELKSLLDGNVDNTIEEEQPTEIVYPKVPFTELQALVNGLVEKMNKLGEENNRLKELLNLE